MNMKCQFAKCTWIGTVAKLHSHFEDKHKSHIKEIKNNTYFEFRFNELFKEEPFLLCGNNKGLYSWISKDDDHNIKCGIHHIGNSDCEKYFVKFGIFAETGVTQLMGPFTTKPGNLEEYELVLPKRTLYIYMKYNKSQNVKIYFTEKYDENNADENYVALSPDNIDWNNSESIPLYDELIKDFTCPSCLKYIRKDARFCENQHYLCSECLNVLLEKNKAICPVCRGSYTNFCSSDKIEALLKLTKFPDEELSDEELSDEGNSEKKQKLVEELSDEGNSEKKQKLVEELSDEGNSDEEFDDDVKIIEIALMDNENGGYHFEIERNTDGNEIEIEIKSVEDMLNLKSLIEKIMSGSNSNN